MSFWQAIDLMEREPDLIFVKEETYDEHPIGQQMRLTDNRKSKFGFKKKNLNHDNPKSLCDLIVFIFILQLDFLRRTA